MGFQKSCFSKILLGVLLAFTTVLTSCNQHKITEYKMQGKTMGTTWSVVAQFLTAEKNKTIFPLSQEETQKDIERELNRINSVMSTYQKDSEITIFNNANSTSFIEVSEELKNLTAKALEVSRQSNGKYDITVAPLVELWGFGQGKHAGRKDVPAKKEIQEILLHVGYQKLEIKKIAGRWYFAKKHGKIKIDLSSIAKGYAVDKIFQLLDVAGFHSIMVEIGGEVRTKGKNLVKKTEWTIGVEKPIKEKRVLYQILHFQEMAMASSGSYRNYFIDKETKHAYSHTIDPQSGYPKEDKLSGVSVLAKDCATADAWATAFMALGKKDAMRIAQEKNISAAFLWLDEKQEVEHQLTGNYKDYTK